jgi:hypothetical protein
VHRKLLLVGLLVVGVALLSGCDLLNQIIDAMTGGGSGGGTGGIGTVVSGRMEFHLAATISQDPQYGDPTYPGVVGTVFRSGSGSYDAATKTFTATWDGGDFSNTYFEARLNATEEYIEYFTARQTQSDVWGAWTYVHEIRGYNVLYSYTDGSSRYFIVDGSDAHVIIDLLTYKAWSTSLGSAQSPTDWVSSPSALTGSADDIISIRLDY